MAPGLTVTRAPRGYKGGEKVWGYRSLRELSQEQEAKDIGWLGNVHRRHSSGTLEEGEGSFWTRR
jgi:hypothetical protein